MKFLDLFSGIGGMGFGIAKAGHECVGFCEIDKFTHAAFNLLHNHDKKMWEGWDVRDVTDDDIRNIERERGKISLISGGFPCQSFSISGNREGFADTRGTLIFEIFRFASILKPRYLFLENVKGLLSHENGETFRIILQSLDELGYDSEWQVLNSKNFGVPQNRERIYIVGHLRGSGGRKVFPLVNEGGGVIEVVGKINIKGHDILKRVYNSENLAPTLNTMQGGNKVPKIIIFGNTKPDHCKNLGQRYQVFDEDGLMGALAASDFKQPKQIFTRKEQRIRTLTPLECFRLQSFPDEWYYKLKINNFSNTQLYKLAGNAVTCNVSYVIAKSLKE